MTRSDRPRLMPPVALLLCLTACGGGGSGGESYVPPGGGNGYQPPPGNTAPPAGTYVRSFGSSGDDHAFALAALPDGGLAIGGLLERRIPGEDRTSWLGVLDSAGAPISQQRVIARDVALGYSAHTSSVVEDRGAVFAGTTRNDQTETDVVVRFYDASGAIQWQRTLDSGRWSGNVELAGRGIDDLEPRLYPVFDANGAWQGVWVRAQASANVVSTNSEGARTVVHRWSETVWFLGPDGTQVSRTRLVFAEAPGHADVLMRSAAVLDTGSLAVLLHEREDNTIDEPLSRRVVRRVGQDGTLGGPTIVLPPSLYEAQLVAVPGALIALADRHVARLDISAQQVLWQIERATLAFANFRWFLATTLDRGGTSLLAVGGIAGDNSAMLHLNLATGTRLRDCALPAQLHLASLRGRPSGNLRALVADGRTLRTVNLADDCQPIAASETVIGESFAARWYELGSDWIDSAKASVTLSRTGDYVHEAVPRLARRRDQVAATAFEVALGQNIATDSGFYLLTADDSGQVGFASEDLIQRRGANGSLVRATQFPGIPWDIAADAEGLIWATAEIPTPAGGCSGGVIVLSAAGRNECRRVADADLTGWTLARGPDGSIWAASGVDTRSVRFLPNGSATTHPSLCVLDDMDVGADQSRVSIDFSERRICREGIDGRSWARELHASAFNDQMEIAGTGNVQAVAASDGGVAVMFTVRLIGEVEGVRSTANIIGDSDIALLKLDAAGNPQWLRVFGGGRDEESEQLVRMADGGYALLGRSDSFDAVTPGSIDLFVVRTGPDGRVARTADGGDACQACIGSVSGSVLLGLLGERQEAVFEAVSAAQPVVTTAITLPDADGVSEPVPGETNARQCTGTVTNVQEGGVTAPPPPTGGEAPVARFTVRALYGGVTANPVSNRDPARFDASTSTPAANIQRYQWDFEDDGTFDAEGYVQMNTYNSRGLKTARLRVTHANGQTAEVALTFTVDAADGYYVRLLPVHDESIPGNRIERIDGALNCVNRADGSVTGVCFGNGSNAPGIETVLRATPAQGSAFANWVGCDLTRAQAEGPPLCVISNDLDGRERLIEAHFVATARATVSVIMTGTTAPQGRVYSMDNRLNCPTICSADFSVNTEVELAATWENDGDFLRFEGCDRAADGLCFVDLGAGGRTVTAVYR